MSGVARGSVKKSLLDGSGISLSLSRVDPAGAQVRRSESGIVVGRQVTVAGGSLSPEQEEEAGGWPGLHSQPGNGQRLPNMGRTARPFKLFGRRVC